MPAVADWTGAVGVVRNSLLQRKKIWHRVGIVISSLSSPYTVIFITAASPRYFSTHSTHLVAIRRLARVLSVLRCLLLAAVISRIALGLGLGLPDAAGSMTFHTEMSCFKQK